MTDPAGGYLDLPLRDFLDAVAAPQAAPGGGAVCAVVVGLAAGLTAMAAGLSGAEFTEVAGEAESLRSLVVPLALADAEAYGAVLRASARPAGDGGQAGAVSRALSRAADVPLEVAEIGARVAALAGHVETAGNPRLRGDAATARLVAGAGVRAAGTLVEINLADPTDPRVVRARGLAASAGEK